MFRKQDISVSQQGPAATAALSLREMLPQFHNGLAVAAPPERWRTRLDRPDLLVDLGADIGSRRWWRGFVTCFGLCGVALSFAPGFPALDMPGGAVMGEAQYQELRADSIAPLAYGADTGRRTGATRAVEPLADTPERPSIDLTATLGRGDGFSRALERVGVSADEAKSVAAMVSGVVPLGQIKPGTRVELTLGRRPNKQVARPLDHLAFRAAFDMRLGVERQNGALALRRMPIAVDNTPLRVQGRVGSSLYRAARAAGAPAAAVEAYIKALASRVSMGAIGADSRFDLIVAQRRAATGEVETGGILMAGLDRGKTTLRLMKWQDADGRESWFDATGTGETKGAMKMPVTGGHTTSSFGMRRHPLLNFSRMHKGMDIGAPMGAPIYAATDGLVRFAGWHGGHGNYVMIGHSDGMATAYAHMSRIVAKPGQHVRMGQVIGYVGSTGLSTGPHLHYEVYRNGVAINPATMKFQTTLRLAGGELARFKARLSGLLATRVGGGETKVAAAGKAGTEAGD